MGLNIDLPNKWAPRSYQVPLWNYLQEGGKRAVAVWHRRAGKDLLAINWIATQMVMRPGLYWHLLPTYQQGRKIVWNGRTRDGRPFLDAIPKDLVEGRNNTEMTIRMKSLDPNYSEGSVYQVVGTEDVDRLVGANPVGCVFSEYSLQDPRAYEYIRPILMENDGWALFIYTARGDNHGRKLFEMAGKRSDKWFSELLHAGDDGTTYIDNAGNTVPVVTDAQIAEAREEGMSEAMIQQEFYNSFDTPVEGSYYGPQMKDMVSQKRIVNNAVIEPRLDVHTAWDIGVNDSTSIIFFQLLGREIRIVDYYEASGEGLQHYAGVLRGKGYLYGTHYAPWDMSIREWTSGAKTRLESARELGINFKVVKKISVVDGIESVRNMLPRVFIDEARCEHLINALREYHKEFDERKKVYRNNPTHDWSSHPCDAIRTMAVGLGPNAGVKREKRQEYVDGDWDIWDT